MPFHVYTVEEFPNTKLMGKAGYTPEYLQWGGISLPPLEAKKWAKLPDNYYNTYHVDWKDRAGTRRHVTGDDLFDRLRKRFENRGLVFLDHEPSIAEKVELERDAYQKNLAFRMTIVEGYENAVREKEVTGKGRTTPTPYEDECYSVLGLTKPYSVEAMRAQRHPGEAVGEQIVAALQRLEARRKDDAVATQSPK